MILHFLVLDILLYFDANTKKLETDLTNAYKLKADIGLAKVLAYNIWTTNYNSIN